MIDPRDADMARRLCAGRLGREIAPFLPRREFPMPPSARPEPDHQLERERWETLRHVVALVEGPMTLLGFVWLGIVIAELSGTVSPLLTRVGTLIWILFLLDFLAELLVAPRRGQYLRRNWLVAVSLAVPALRILRFVSLLRVARAARIVGASRGLRLLRLVTSFNRGMQALRRSMARRGFSYVVALSVIVVLAGAGGMLAFDGRTGANPQGFRSYGEALWWTAMIITTMGSDYWPQSAAGRLLCLLLALYAFAMFGYVTASLATFFVGRDAEDGQGEIAGEEALRSIALRLDSLHEELRSLKRGREDLERG